MRWPKSSSELMTVVEERNKNRHPPRIAGNNSDHRRGAIIGEKGDKGSSGSFSRFTGTCKILMVCSLHIYENVIPETDVYSD